MLMIYMHTDNDAFQEDPAGEISSRLGVIDTEITSGLTKGPIRDSNGNTVGGFTYLPQACGADFDIAAHDANGELIAMVKAIPAPALPGAYIALERLYPGASLDYRVHEPKED